MSSPGQAEGVSDGPIGPPVGQVPPRQRALLAAAFWKILGSAAAATPAQLAAAAGVPAESVAEDLAALAAAGRIRRTASGDVLGSLGLTGIPTSHEVRIGDARRYTWCALDAVGILGALDSDGRIDSTNRATGGRFRVDFAAGSPTGHDPSWVLFIAARREVSSVIDEWCPLVNFFEDAAGASSWAAERGVAGESLTLAEATRFGARFWRQALAAAPPIGR